MQESSAGRDTRASMQLQDQVVGDCAYPQYDHANKVKGMHMFGVDRACALRAGGEKQRAIGFRDFEFDREPARDLWKRPGLRQHAGLRDLPLSLRPDDRIDLGLDDTTRIRLERELR